MFENYQELSVEAKEQIKAIHKAVKADFSLGHRVRNLAWAFVRGWKYRRVERKTRTQTLGDGKVVVHNQAPIHEMTQLLAKHLPRDLFPVKVAYGEVFLISEALRAWRADETGAIEAPAPRKKEQYERAAE